jgi:CelD/BcsL family acetyltransferase involved in cellulose biosynthesis
MVHRSVGEGDAGQVVSIEIIKDIERLREMRQEWNELLAESASDCMFLTWEWLSTWWRYLSGDRKLFIVTVRSQGRLHAIAPLVVRPPGISNILPFPALEFMGTGSVGSDYLDVIIRRGEEAFAANALAECMAGMDRAIELEQVKIGDCSVAEIGRLMGSHGWSVQEEQTNISRHINLAGRSWPSYLASLGGAHRYNFKRRLRHLERDFDLRFEKHITEEERRAALGRLMALHGARWRGYSKAFHTPNHQKFHEEITRLACERGWLRIYTLWLDGETVAALYGFRYGRVFYFYQSGFDPAYARYSTGLVTMGLCIESAIAEGVVEYDMLQGVEQYKELWAHESRPLGRLEFYPPHVRGFVYRRAMELSRAARKAARRVFPKKLTDMIAVRRELATRS